MTAATQDGQAAEAAEDGRVRMVVISDIHATEESEPLTNVARASAEDPAANALTAACEFLPGVVEEVDCVLCPGDLVDQGRTAPMGWVWEKLQGLAGQLDAALVATAGNHDMALSATVPDLPHSALRALSPRFPADDLSCVDSYWAHDLAIVSGNSWRVVSINSCAHVYFDEAETKHGRIGRDCMAELPGRLDSIGTDRPVNVCVVHHHPQEWTEDSDDPTSHMYEGDRLIKLLEDRPERWMLIHGHMHHPRLDYIGHGSGGTVRLASGSLGANLLADSGIQFRNQIHVVDFDLSALKLGLMVAGEVRSYDWEPGQGWCPPTPDSGLAARETFGYRRDGIELAAWMGERARELDRRTWTWEEIVAEEPRCRYLAQVDRAAFHVGVRRLGGGVVEAREEVTFTW